jgi:hypothetical protein
MWWVLWIILVLSIIAWRLYLSLQSPRHTSHVQFLEPEELAWVLAQNENGYQSSMTDADKKARSAADMPMQRWTSHQKRTIRDIVKNITTPLRFGLSTPSCECGMPHTRGNVIVLPANRITREVIEHEKIHIWQKASPKAFSQLYTAWEFAPFAGGDLPSNIHQRLRNNPDTLTTPRQWIWRGRWIPVPLYNGGTHMSVDYMLYDIETGTLQPWHNSEMSKWFGVNATQPEHPHELIATMLTAHICDTTNKQKTSSPAEHIILQWYEQHH